MTQSETDRNSHDNSSDALLIMTIPPELEDDMVDWLLAEPATAGFTSLPAFGHGGAHHQLSIAERVAGKQRRVQFQITLPQVAAANLLHAFQSKFAANETHAWVIPLLATTPKDPQGS